MESTSEVQKPTEVTTKVTEEETEVPPPPGTEPLLPIPAIGSSPERETDHSCPPNPDNNEKDHDYPQDKQSKERRRSFSRESHRERYIQKK